MSRGLGTTQRAILAALHATEDNWLSIADLAEQIDRSDRQVRTAVRALEHRGHVAVTRECVSWDPDRGTHGMPVHGLAVWLPQRRAAYEAYWQRLLGQWRGA